MTVTLGLWHHEEEDEFIYQKYTYTYMLPGQTCRRRLNAVQLSHVGQC